MTETRKVREGITPEEMADQLRLEHGGGPDAPGTSTSVAQPTAAGPGDVAQPLERGRRGPKKRARGRPKGSSSKKLAPAVQVPAASVLAHQPIDPAAQLAAQIAALQPMIFLGMSAFINRKFPTQPYTDEEAGALAAAAVQVALKHEDTLIGRHIEELTLCGVLVMQISTRALNAPRDVTAESEAQGARRFHTDGPVNPMPIG